MRQVFTLPVDQLQLPEAAARRAANAGASTQAENDRWMQDWACMNALERVQPPGGAGITKDKAAARAPLVVAAWNIERCKHVEASAALLARVDPDIVLATEMDWGCARSSQRHTTADLAKALGLGYVFGVEFVELALGDARETAEHAGEENLHGLHGNAVLSRFPIRQVALLPLDDGGKWYVSDLKQGQRRIGGRNAIAAELETPLGMIWAVSVHYESESTPATREAATRRMLAGLAGLTGDAPVVIGGDFNVFELSRQGLDDATMFATPDSAEPSFATLRDAGFRWDEANTPGVTTRSHPWQPADRPGLRIDWLFIRGLKASEPWIAPALAADGTVISDHEAIGATLHLAGS